MSTLSWGLVRSMLSWFGEFPIDQVFRGLGGPGLTLIKGMVISQRSGGLVCPVLNWVGGLLVGPVSGGLDSPVLSSGLGNSPLAQGLGYWFTLY